MTGTVKLRVFNTYWMWTDDLAESSYLGSNFIHSVLLKYFSVQSTRLSIMLWIAGDWPGGEPLEDELLCNAAISCSPSVIVCSEEGELPTRMSSFTAPSMSSPPFSDSEPTLLVCLRSFARLKKRHLKKRLNSWDDDNGSFLSEKSNVWAVDHSTLNFACARDLIATRTYRFWNQILICRSESWSCLANSAFLKRKD